MTVRRRASRLFPVEERTAFPRPGFLSEKTAQTLANGSELCYTERGKMIITAGASAVPSASDRREGGG